MEDEDVKEEELKEAFRKKAMECHPDRQGGREGGREGRREGSKERT